MAQRRMISLKIIDTDNFLDMPVSARELYFQLVMRADDDGFIGNPKRILKMIGATDDDFKVLLIKKFIIPFESGVCVIKDWKIHNYIRSDRYIETEYKDEKNMLIEKNNKYLLKSGMSSGIPNDIPLGDTGKDRLGKDRLNTSLKEKGKKPVSYGNEDINYLLTFLKEQTGLSKFDGTKQQNRRYCWLALKKFGNKEKVAIIIKTAMASDFHRKNLTSFKYLYYNGVKIMAEFKDAVENPTYVKIK